MKSGRYNLADTQPLWTQTQGSVGACGGSKWGKEGEVGRKKREEGSLT